jgi:hypothetical protein
MTITKKTKALTQEPVPVPLPTTDYTKKAPELNVDLCQDKQIATT